MKLRRLLPLTCSMAASVAMTACGGGDSNGPAWAQDLKATIASTGSPAATAVGQATVAALLPGEYRGTCEVFETGGTSASIQVLTVSQQGGETRMTQRVDLYDNPSCTDDTLLGSVTQPSARLTQDGEGVDATSGKRFVKVTATSAGGDVLFTVEPDAALTLSNETSTSKRVFFESASYARSYPTKVAAGTAKDVYALIDGSLYRGDDATRQPASTGFATALTLTAPFKPFKQFDVVPGTYGGECQAQDFGTGHQYGVLAKETFLLFGPDRRTRFTSTLEVYDEPTCSDKLLYIVKFPTVSVDTVGNYKVNISGDDTQPITVDARQVILNYPAGAIEVTLDQTAELSGLVSLSQEASGPAVTFLADKNNKLSYRDKTAEAVKSLRYAAGPLVFFGDADPQTADPVTTFPTKLLQNTPLSLIERLPD